MQQKYRNITPLYYKDQFCGFQISMRFQGVTFTRRVSVNAHFDAADCLQAAIVVRDQMRENLTGNPHANLRSLSKVGNTNKVSATGMTGVHLKGASYRVTWRENGRYKSKSFGFGKNGKNWTQEEALLLAVQHRKAMVATHYR